jgi:hypothetical protein
MVHVRLAVLDFEAALMVIPVNASGMRRRQFIVRL